MCGIIAIIKRKNDGVNTAAAIVGMLKSQIARGNQGFGYIGFDDELKSYVRRETRTEIEDCLEGNQCQSIVFHHRWPTSTPNYADCTHPIKISHEELEYDYYVVHNGMISNDTVLHDKYVEENGYKYTTTIENIVRTENNIKKFVKWNDSESLAINLARYIEGKEDKIAAKGSIAFIATQVDKTTKKIKNIFFGRNTNPLTILFTENSLVLRSEGEKEEIASNLMYSLDIENWTISEKECDIGEIMSQKYPTYGGRHSIEDEMEYLDAGRYISTPAVKVYAPSNYTDDLIDDASAIELSRLDEKAEKIEDEIAQWQSDIDFYKGHKNHKVAKEAKNNISRLKVELEQIEDEKEIIYQEVYGDAEIEHYPS